MRTRIVLLTCWLPVLLVAASCSRMVETDQGSKSAQEGAKETGQSLRVAVVTGMHSFDVPHFYQMLRELESIDAYPQHIEHFASSSEEIRDAYEVVVFYGMGRGIPVEEGAHYEGKPRAALERLAERGQGIVVLHHALLAWEEWDTWNQIVGFDNRNFAYKEGLQLQIEVADAEHAITQGIESFEITDEGYKLHGTHDGQGDVLLTVQHENAMAEVAWSRQHDASRVFCLALGHDDQAWTNPSFRQVLQRGVLWTAGQ